MIFDDKLKEFGDKIQNAMEAIDTIVRYPQHLRDVKFEDIGPASVFNEDIKTLRFEITYLDAPEIKGARKGKLEEYEKELEAELAKLKKAKEGL